MKCLKNFLMRIYNSGRKFVIRQTTLIVSIFSLFIFIYFINILQNDPGLANALVALGTLILALVTSLHIINSNEQEKHRREAELLRETRERKERLLNDISEWATELSNFSIRPDIELLNVKDVKAAYLWSYNKWYEFLLAKRQRGESFARRCRVFWPSLSVAIKNILPLLDNAGSALPSSLPITKEQKEQFEACKDVLVRLSISVETIIKKVDKIISSNLKQ